MLLRAASFSMISFSPFYKQRPFYVKDPRLGYTSLPMWTAHPLTHHLCWLCCHALHGAGLWVSMKTATCPLIFTILERRVNFEQRERGRNGMFSPLLFHFLSFHWSLPLWVNIWAQSQVTWFMTLVYWWAGCLFPLLLKRLSKTLGRCWKNSDTG